MGFERAERDYFVVFDPVNKDQGGVKRSIRATTFNGGITLSKIQGKGPKILTEWFFNWKGRVEAIKMVRLDPSPLNVRYVLRLKDPKPVQDDWTETDFSYHPLIPETRQLNWTLANVMGDLPQCSRLTAYGVSNAKELLSAITARSLEEPRSGLRGNQLHPRQMYEDRSLIKTLGEIMMLEAPYFVPLTENLARLTYREGVSRSEKRGYVPVSLP